MLAPPGAATAVPGDQSASDTSTPNAAVHSVALLQSYLRMLFEPSCSSMAAAAGGSGGTRALTSAVRGRIAELQAALSAVASGDEVPQLQLPSVLQLEELVAAAGGGAVSAGDITDAKEDAQLVADTERAALQWGRSVSVLSALVFPAPGQAVADVAWDGAADRPSLHVPIPTVPNSTEAQLRRIAATAAQASRLHALAESPAAAAALALLQAARRMQPMQKLQRALRQEVPRVVQGCQALAAVAASLPEGGTFAGVPATPEGLATLGAAAQDILSALQRADVPAPALHSLLFLLRCSAKDLAGAVAAAVGRATLLHLPHDDFKQLVAAAVSICADWSTRESKIVSSAVTSARAGGEALHPRSQHLSSHPKALKARLSGVTEFRSSYEALRSVVRAAFRDAATNGSSDAGGMLSDLDMAFAEACSVDCLDCTAEGTQTWNTKVANYKTQAAATETLMSARLQGRLSQCSDTAQLMQVLNVFGPLLSRPRVASAIASYQTKLLQVAQQDLTALARVFSAGWAASDAASVAAVHHGPPVASAVAWLRQLQRATSAVAAVTRTVAGADWRDNSAARQLHTQCETFFRKLDPAPVVAAWVQSVTASLDGSVDGPVWALQAPKGKPEQLQLQVAFNASLEELIAESTQLKTLGFTVPSTLRAPAKFAAYVFPMAARLRALCKGWRRDASALSIALAPLLAAEEEHLRALVASGVDKGLHWDSPALPGYVGTFASAVQRFGDMCATAQAAEVTVHAAISALQREPLSVEGVTSHVLAVQDAVTRLDIGAFADADTWAHDVRDSLAKVLSGKLQQAIPLWAGALQGAAAASAGAAAGHLDATLLPAPVKLQMRLRDSTVTVTPAIHDVRGSLFRSMNTLLEAVMSQRLVCATSTGAAGSTPAESDARDGTQHSLGPHVYTAGVSAAVGAATGAVEAVLGGIAAHTQHWLSLEALWGISAADMQRVAGTDVLIWRSMLDSMTAQRASLADSPRALQVGLATLLTGEIVDIVQHKLQSWHREALAQFANVVRSEVASFSAAVRLHRGALEEVALTASSSSGAIVAFITATAAAETAANTWAPRLQALADAEGALSRQHFAFPSDWLWLSQADGDWSAFQQILKRRKRDMTEQLPGLKRLVHSTDAELSGKCNALLGEWAVSQPTGADVSLTPETALAVLAEFEARASALTQRWNDLDSARGAIGMDVGTACPLGPLQTDISGLQGVWRWAGSLHAKMAELRNTPWPAVAPSRVRSALLDLSAQVEQAPAAVQQYSVHSSTAAQVHALKSTHQQLVALKASCMQPRHWLRVARLLQLQQAGTHEDNQEHGGVDSLSEDSIMGFVAECTLGDLWACDLVRHAGALAPIFTQAEGEGNLASFLVKLRNDWRGTALLAAPVAGGAKGLRVVRNFGDITEQLDEHLSFLTSMKASPYFEAFRDEAGVWNSRLGAFRVTVELFIDVQRKWLHLSGLFSGGSSSIRAQLPAEWGRFRGADAELQGVLRKTSQPHGVSGAGGGDSAQSGAPPSGPTALSVMAQGDLNGTLGRLGDTLSAVQKALGAFLEKQRALFARFYFLGDEDLLELLGATDAVAGTKRHVARMFAGVSGFRHVQMEGEGGATSVGVPVALTAGTAKNTITITSMQSRDGEQVALTHVGDSSTKLASRDGSAAAVPAAVTLLRALEGSMRSSLAAQLQLALGSCTALQPTSAARDPAAVAGEIVQWWSPLAAQIVTCALYISWTHAMRGAIGDAGAMQGVSEQVLFALKCIALHGHSAATAGSALTLEHSITSFVHMRDMSRRLTDAHGASPLTPTSYDWMACMRHSWQNASDDGSVGTYTVSVADADFGYGFEYLGVTDRLVVTDLTERCFVTLTQALRNGMGGTPFGPAGTGKTESVKALGGALGRHVLVFNCDEAFDVGSMGRIFTGLCQTGGWGCFDEFNRLEERILSAVSAQIQGIQEAILAKQRSVVLLGNQVALHPNVGIFVTMNPGYAGRAELPDNLKALFRPCAMMVPDWQAIAEVMLFAQGFFNAETLSMEAVTLFQLCREQLSRQVHYDFGLRALKQVLVSAGVANRAAATAAVGDSESKHADAAAAAESVLAAERSVLLRSISDSTVPKLVPADTEVFLTLCSTVFRDVQVEATTSDELQRTIEVFAEHNGAVASVAWCDKVQQLLSVLTLRHGVMIVGPSGAGKSGVLRAAVFAQSSLQGRPVAVHVIDPKAQPKEQLYGQLHSATLEWTDGIFTHLLRAEIAVAQEHAEKAAGGTLPAVWIVFDGDVDPEWAENLNSVLDDNKLLTLPSGERLPLPSHVRVIVETHSLEHATPATVSRCGMVWLHSGVVSMEHQLARFAFLLKTRGVQGAARLKSWGTPALVAQVAPAALAQHERITVEAFSSVLCSALNDKDCAPLRALERFSSEAATLVMELPSGSAVASFAAMYTGGARAWLAQTAGTPDIVPSSASAEAAAGAWMAYSSAWCACAADVSTDRLAAAAELCNLLPGHVRAAALRGSADATLEDSVLGSVPADGAAYVRDTVLGKSDTSDSGAQWVTWLSQVSTAAMDSQAAAEGDTVVETGDTMAHSFLIRSWMDADAPLVLCGPPGSGKTMTLTAALHSDPTLKCATMAFSSGTGPAAVLQCLEQYCVYSAGPEGIALAPANENSTLVLFADEVNLPEPDAFGTQTAIAFMRCVIEHGGYWSPPRKLPGVPGTGDRPVWVHINGVRFVGACNPPGDAGRTELSSRFLRHAPLLHVGFPSPPALKHIFGTMVGALLGPHGTLRSLGASVTDAMVQVYTANSAKFKAEQWAHYVYSPRELSRWVRALGDALAQSSQAWSALEFIQLWSHEAMRIFGDRLVQPADVQWCADEVRGAAGDILVASSDGSAEQADEHDPEHALLSEEHVFTTLVTGSYERVSVQKLRSLVTHRARDFSEEVQSVQLCVFDGVLHHLARIDRVLGQPSGHLLLVGQSGAGKTLLTQFAAWARGLPTVRLKLHRKYGPAEFDADLRSLLTRAGVGGEHLVFIFDEGNVLDTSFLERMNALLASGEVPGLFEGDDKVTLYAGLRDAAASASATASSVASLKVPPAGASEEQLYSWFVARVRRNLHVAMTMNPATADFTGRAATSPALFNRCIVDWFGDWSAQALSQTAAMRFAAVDLGPAAAAAGAGSFVLDEDALEEQLANLVPFIQQAVATSLAVESRYDESHLLTPAVQQGAALVTAATRVHLAAVTSAADAATGAETRTFVTPRHFLDFVGQLVQQVAAQRDTMAEQQLRVSRGLAKLTQTSAAVESMQAGLAEKEAALTAKRVEAEHKLGEMLQKQRIAEEQRKQSETLAQQVAQSETEVAARRGDVEERLSNMGPMLEAAAAGLASVSRSALDEVRGLQRPPNLVRMTMEAVVALLDAAAGAAAPEAKAWAAVRRDMQKRDFVGNMMSFDTETVTPAVRCFIQDRYLSESIFNEESVTRSSKVCGALYKWMVSQVQYAEALQTVAPLRAEVSELQHRADELSAKAAQVAAELDALECAVVQYKAEYSELVGSSQVLEAELNTVRAKVTRARGLVASLGDEQTRWAAACERFGDQEGGIVGNATLCAAFVAYAGFFGHSVRASLHLDWCSVLQDSGIPYDAEAAPGANLLAAGAALKWRTAGAPDDELTDQNTGILGNAARFPLVLDPTGGVLSYVCSHTAAATGNAAAVVSYLDSAFPKRLESALRFGNTLLVTDAEAIDPLLNSVLGQEFSYISGRRVVTVGANDVDVSPGFNLMLFTADVTHQFAPDLLSRVTFVNNAVTLSSLKSVCLTQVLGAQRPDIAAQRTESLRLHSEYASQLKALEDEVLSRLSTASASLLDDDVTLQAMESLKQESAAIAGKAAEVQAALSEMDTTASTLSPIVQCSVALYFTLRALPELHAMYRWSLPFFMGCLASVLEAAGPLAPGATSDVTAAHVHACVRGLAVAVLEQVRPAMFREHASALTVRVLTATADALDLSVPVQALQAAMQPPGGSTLHKALKKAVKAAPQAVPPAKALSALAASEGDTASALSDSVQAHPEQWLSLCGVALDLDDAADGDADDDDDDDSATEASLHGTLRDHGVPTDWTHDEAKLEHCWFALCVALACVPSMAPAALQHLETALLKCSDKSLNNGLTLEEVVAGNRVPDPTAPVLIASTRGVDAVQRVQAAAAAAGTSVVTVAMGGDDGFSTAHSALEAAMRRGTWCLLTNVHLVPRWLATLAQSVLSRSKYGGSGTKTGFKLLLTTQVSQGPHGCNAPPLILRASAKVLLQPTNGVRQGVLSALRAVPSATWNAAPVEGSRALLGLCWLHAILSERARFAPQGWTKAYEFSDADLVASARSIRSWVALSSGVAGTAPPQHVDPGALPWGAMARVCVTAHYGGRLSTETDQAALKHIVEHCLHEKLFKVDANLTLGPLGQGAHAVRPPPPSAVTAAEFVQWAEQLPTTNPPQWLGLPAGCETQVAAAAAALVRGAWGQLGDQHAQATGADAAGDSAEALQHTIQSTSEALAGTQTQVAQALETLQGAKNTPTSSALQRWLLVETLAIQGRTQDAAETIRVLAAHEAATAAVSAGDSDKTPPPLLPAARGVRAMLLRNASAPKRWTDAAPRHTAGASAISVADWLHSLAECAAHIGVLVSALADGGAAGVMTLGATDSAADAADSSTALKLGLVSFPQACVAACAQTAAVLCSVPVHSLQLQLLGADTTAAGSESPRAVVRMQGLTLQGARLEARGAMVVQWGGGVSHALPVSLWAWVPNVHGSTAPDFARVPVYTDGSRREQVALLQAVGDARALLVGGAALLCRG